MKFHDLTGQNKTLTMMIREMYLFIFIGIVFHVYKALITQLKIL